jgi:hypothetical protein
MDLKKIAQEIRDIISERQKEFQLTFEEESHKYTMLDKNGVLKSDFPSVSKVMKLFYDEFPTEQAAFNKAGGDPDEAERLVNEWAELGRKSTNLGSRCHFFLEEHTLKEFGIDKVVRQPIFDCDAEQIIKSDTMIIAGKRYIELLKERGCEVDIITSGNNSNLEIPFKVKKHFQGFSIYYNKFGSIDWIKSISSSISNDFHLGNSIPKVLP